jgi:hypothetical protein
MLYLSLIEVQLDNLSSTIAIIDCSTERNDDYVINEIFQPS